MAEAVTGLPEQLAEGVLSSIAFTASPLISLMGETGEQLVEQSRAAFVSGIGDALLLATVILIVAAVAVAALAPSFKSRPDPDLDAPGE